MFNEKLTSNKHRYKLNIKKNLNSFPLIKGARGMSYMFYTSSGFKLVEGKGLRLQESSDSWRYDYPKKFRSIKYLHRKDGLK